MKAVNGAVQNAWHLQKKTGVVIQAPVRWYRVETCAVELGPEVALVATIWPWADKSLESTSMRQPSVTWLIDLREGDKTQRLMFQLAPTVVTARAQAEAALGQFVRDISSRRGASDGQ